ncbi:MAG: hypothetical protein WCW17_03230 [Patescibacteria group bacterium]
MRSNIFLKIRLLEIWLKYFNDTPKRNEIEIKFGRCAVKRLGSIRSIKNPKNGRLDTLIYINGYFRDPKIPEFMIDATIAHELCHYAQGFASPLPQLSPYPHRGGAIDKEVIARGLGHLIKFEKKWLKKYWFRYISLENK